MRQNIPTPEPLVWSYVSASGTISGSIEMREVSFSKLYANSTDQPYALISPEFRVR